MVVPDPPERAGLPAAARPRRQGPRRAGPGAALRAFAAGQDAGMNRWRSPSEPFCEAVCEMTLVRDSPHVGGRDRARPEGRGQASLASSAPAAPDAQYPLTTHSRTPVDEVA